MVCRGATVWPLVWLTALGCSGNNDETAQGVEPPGACAAGEWQREDGACIAAGLPPDMPCPPGEWQRDDGACIPAGVPPDGCGAGFAHDGDRGCEAILPSEPCAPGLMAVPGETACREVAPCAAGKWGGIPVEPDTEYVDASYAQNDSDGSALKPWTSIQEAVDAAPSGAIVAIAAGSYVEDVVLSMKPVRLWGVCPALVEIVGTGGGFAAVLVWGGGAGTEVHDLAVRGPTIGVGSTSSLDALLERVWVHDTAGWGVESVGAPIRLRGSLVEHSYEIGVFGSGSEVTVDASVVRDTQLNGEGLFGRGIHVRATETTGAPSTLLLQASLIERNHSTGVYVSGSDASVAASVVRDTNVDANGTTGIGAAARPDPTTGAPSTLLLDTSLVERNHQAGVYISFSEANLVASVVRDTQPTADGLFGRGVTVQSDDITAAPATVGMRTSLIERSNEMGLFIGGSDATVEASVVRDTQPSAEGNGGGVIAAPEPMSGAPSTLALVTSLVERNHEAGVGIRGSEASIEASVVRESRLDAEGKQGIGVTAWPNFATGAASTVALRTTLVEQNYELGVFVVGSQATVEASVVRGTQPNALGLGGRGMNVEAYEGTPATVLLRGLLVEQSYELGVAVVGAAATIDSCHIRDTVTGLNGLFGDSVIVTAELGPATATIDNTRIERSARAAVSVHGAHLAIVDSALSCQAFDLDYENYFEIPSTLDNLGGNLCGCPEPVAPCKAVSAGLDPPTSLAP